MTDPQGGLPLWVPKSVRTQGQYDLCAACFEALREALDGYFSGDPERARRGRQALDKVLDSASQVQEILDGLEEIPEGERSARAKTFTEPPREFYEQDNHHRLLAELDELTTLVALNEWYARTRPMRDRLVSVALRNELLDKVRAKSASLREIKP